MIKNKGMMTDKDAAEELCISPQALRTRRRKNLPPRFYKIGRSVLYKIEDILAFKESCLREPLEEKKGH